MRRKSRRQGPAPLPRSPYCCIPFPFDREGSRWHLRKKNNTLQQQHRQQVLSTVHKSNLLQEQGLFSTARRLSITSNAKYEPRGLRPRIQPPPPAGQEPRNPHASLTGEQTNWPRNRTKRLRLLTLSIHNLSDLSVHTHRHKYPLRPHRTTSDLIRPRQHVGQAANHEFYISKQRLPQALFLEHLAAA